MILRAGHAGAEANRFARGFFGLDGLRRLQVAEGPGEHVPTGGIIRIEFHAAANFANCADIVIFGAEIAADGHVSLGEVGIDNEGAPGKVYGALVIGGIGINVAIVVALDGRKSDESGGVIWIQLQGLLKIFSRGFEFLWLIFLFQENAAHHVGLIGLGIFCVAALDGLLFLGREAEIEGFGDFKGELFLEREDVLIAAGEIVGPGLEAGGGIDQLDIDANLIAGFADAAFEKIADAELPAEIGGRCTGTFESGDGGVGSDVDTLQFGELGGNFVGHAGGEISAVWAGAEIFEIENGDGRAGGRSGGMRAGRVAIPEECGDGEKCEERGAGDVTELAVGLWRHDGGRKF